MSTVSSDSITQIARRWVAAFAARDARAFAQNYSESAEYIDHAFQLRRTGRQSIEQHIELWTNSIPDFAMKVDRFDVVGQQALFSYVGTGTFVNDLPRLQATGQSFIYEGFVVLTVGEEGLLDRTEEFYSVSFASGVPFADYHFRGSDKPRPSPALLA
jgi:SnoaL-like domain